MNGAERDGVRPPWLSRWTEHHARVMFTTLGRLWREPLSTLFTAAVIGITLALPAGLHVLVQNVRAISYSWEESLQASLFLKDSTSPEQGRALTQTLQRRPGVARAGYISREQSLAEFRELSGFGQALDLLQDNPLPAVIVITPRRELTREQLQQLMNEFSALPEVEIAKLDQKWLERLYAILAIVERVVYVIAALLALAVMVTVGNTIRLDIENRREEIMVMKLIGAPNSFIRRPFLYTGVWYGLLGGLIAWLLLYGALQALTGPALRLASLYESTHSLTGLSPASSLLMPGVGILLGILGSAWAVGRHLVKHEPS
ncbi:MAG: permease-like cell division protein FtsX [Nevskiales bacterium]|nr:permease-like cell division protein FtsX [Nevskiales bacterium]